MASTNRVFVSPGVYTSEKDLTFVAQSVGITTLGMAGETLKGPAFEPVLIGSFDEFKTYFGGTSTEKYANGNPKYELPYFAKSYLQQSNQLFVTRVLGLTGYRPGNSWVITTTSNNAIYNNVVVAVLRSRGSYSGSTLSYTISDPAGLTLSDTTVMSGNPMAAFTLSSITTNQGFSVSMDPTQKTFITKVLGTGVFDKRATDIPVYVAEDYSGWLRTAYLKGNITGLNISLAAQDEGANYINEWTTAHTPWLVSEVRGNKVVDLFRFITVSDGEASNTDVKVSIINVNLQTLEFDVIVRDFNDTDDNVSVLERFTRCSMNPDLPSFIGKKIGTNNGDYALNSRLIMVELADNFPTDAVPAGFKGYPTKSISGATVGALHYKTHYATAGEVIYTTPTNVISNGDKIRKTYLGVQTVDKSLLSFKGMDSTGTTKGFHLSAAASGVTDNNGNALYRTNSLSFEASEGDYASLNACKFTVVAYGGFDGWDIYRSERTNTDSYVFGKTLYSAGETSGGGVFDFNQGNSDYYAYLQAIQTFNNPTATNINLFATPGINFQDHTALVSEAIDMIEIDRADSLYIINAPNAEDVEGALEAIDGVDIDSNYSATYFPWIQIKDVDNGNQIYIPPTGEVLKNIALTDNVAYPWFAPAGYNRGTVNAIRAAQKLTLDERDDLYKNRINPIATFSDVGPIIWGNKTLQVRESALDRINVRRLLLQARKLISAVAVKLLFEQDDATLREDFLRQVNPILTSIQNERGLTDFRVTVSDSVEDMDNNTLSGEIFIKPTRSLEFVTVGFTISNTGASFDNI
jgi:hypothetical protein